MKVCINGVWKEETGSSGSIVGNTGGSIIVRIGVVHFRDGYTEINISTCKAGDKCIVYIPYGIYFEYYEETLTSSNIQDGYIIIRSDANGGNINNALLIITRLL